MCIRDRCNTALPGLDISETAILLEGTGSAVCIPLNPPEEYAYGATILEFDWDNDLRIDQEPEVVRWADGALQAGCGDPDRSGLRCISLWTGGGLTVFTAAPTIEETQTMLEENIIDILSWVPTINTDGIEPRSN